MKPSLSLMKMTIKLLILMILFVMIFIISILLYSARYWPDIYNYINANITIKRIPTISELNVTIIEVEYITETYTTTDVDYIDISTIDPFDVDEFTLEDVEAKNDVKRSILIEKTKDYIELPSRSIFVDYVFLEEPVTDLSDVPGDTYVPNEISKEINYKKATDLTNESTTHKTVVIHEGKANQNALETLPVYEESRYSIYKEHDTHKVERIVEQIYKNVVPTFIDSGPYKQTIYSGNYNPNFDKTDSMSEVTDDEVTSKEGYAVRDSSREIDEEITIDLTTATNDDFDLYTRVLKDSVDVSKLTTRSSDDVEMFTGRPFKMVKFTPETPCDGNATCEEFTKAVYPWIVAVFVKSGSNHQFSYHCDGALLSDKVILTDARCVHSANKTLDPEDILVFLGKGSLQIMDGHEKIQKIKQIIVHENFTAEDKISNDLALLVMDESVVLTNNIQTACLYADNKTDDTEAATTAWGVAGELMPIFFNKEKAENCYDKDENIFCATYGNEVTLCPSYGGIYAVKRSNKWCLHAIFYGDPAERGICFNKNVYYTSLSNYVEWIDNVIDINKKYL